MHVNKTLRYTVSIKEIHIKLLTTHCDTRPKQVKLSRYMFYVKLNCILTQNVVIHSYSHAIGSKWDVTEAVESMHVTEIKFKPRKKF